MRGTCVCVRVIAALLIMLLGHYSGGALARDLRPSAATATAAATTGRQQRRDNRNGSAVTSYYQHDPYGPNTYAFGYEVDDNRTGNVQFRDERRYLNGSTLGSYGYVRPDGRVTITHFVSDARRGYLSHTQTYSRTGEKDDAQPWQAHWPTMRPEAHLLAGGGGVHEPLPLNATFDEEQRLNVTVGGVPQAIADALHQQHGMLVHVSADDLVGQVLAPSLLDILDGRVPVQKKPPANGSNATTAAATTATVGFETVHNFIPSDFALMPFEPPSPPPSSPLPPYNGHKYDSAKENNAEKTPHAHSYPHQHMHQALSSGADPPHSSNTPAPLSGPAGVVGVADGHWYERIINATRREFLDNLPNL